MLGSTQHHVEFVLPCTLRDEPALRMDKDHAALEEVPRSDFHTFGL